MNDNDSHNNDGHDEDLQDPVPNGSPGDEHRLPQPHEAFDRQTPDEGHRAEPYSVEPSYVSVACITCGYNLTGVAIGGVCPECGSSVDASLVHGEPPSNGMAITSMVLGIISLVGTCCCPAGLVGIVGLVFGIVAMNQIGSGHYSSGSRGMAIAGVICSSIATLLGVVGTVLMALG